MQRSSSPVNQHLYWLVTKERRYLPLDGTTENMRRAAQPKTVLLYDLDVVANRIGDEACRLLPLPSDESVMGRLQPCYLTIRKGLPRLRRGMNDV